MKQLLKIKGSKLKFGTKKAYRYTPGQHSCHHCKGKIMNGLHLHHHHGKKSKGGVKTTPIHDTCHRKVKNHGNLNHILSQEDRRKAGLKTYKTNLRNQPNFIKRPTNASHSIQNSFGTPTPSTTGSKIESR